MRLLVIATMFALPAACWSEPRPPVVVKPPEPVGKLPATCSEAAIGLERGTRDLRAPERSLVKEVRAQCLDGGWSPPAIECFATMKSGDLGRCAKLLNDAQREAMLGELAGTDQASVAIALVKLANLKIGIAECDRFVATVALVLGCEAMALETRISLGTETADAWSLPTKNLPVDAAKRMAKVCQESLDSLVANAASVGCM